MSDQDSTRKINPYQPPTPVTADMQPATVTIEHESIAFSGVADRRDLKELISSYDNLGWYPIVTGILFLSLLQLWATIISAVLAVIVAGGALFVVLMAVTSSRWYRTRVFQTAHPHWYQRVSGELTPTGMQIQRVTDSSFYRWSFFAGVVVTDKLVAFIPARESESPILIGPSMLPPAVSMEQLKTFARSVKVVCESQFEGQSINWANQLVMQAPDRDRTTDVPADAVRFQGMVRGADVNALPRQLSRPQRPLRATMVRVTLAIALGMVAVGLLAFWWRADVVMTLILLTICCLLFGIGWLQFFRVGMRKIADDDELYYLVGHANDTGITTDFFVSVTTCPWSNIRVVDQSSDRMVLSHKMSRRILITRNDMFSSEQSWKEFCALAESMTT